MSTGRRWTAPAGRMQKGHGTGSATRPGRMRETQLPVPGCHKQNSSTENNLEGCSIILSITYNAIYNLSVRNVVPTLTSNER
jgi:hypothetical protein